MTDDLQVPTLTFADADGEHCVSLDRISTSIGRSPGQEIVLHDAHVSRQHALILRDGKSFTVVDQKSSYGTFVNGKRVESAVLRDADLLQFGSLEGTKIRFRSPMHTEEHSTGRRSLAQATLLTSLHSFKSPDDTLRPAAREIGQLNWLLSAARQLNAGGAIGEILTTLLELTLQLTGVERGFVFLKEGDEMKFARGF